MKRDSEGIVGLDICRESVTHSFVFLLVGAEEAIPDNERASMIAIDVLRVRSVMHSMMRWRIEHGFERSIESKIS